MRDPAYARVLEESFERLTGAALGDPWTLAKPLVSHGTEPDPIFRYANPAALALWEMDWDSFTKLPSRHSAQDDPAIQTDRSTYLAQAAAKGWVSDYQGIRISATGRRFAISQTILWTVTDLSGRRHGQAALIGQVERLDEGRFAPVLREPPR
jgi:hypothetical protein